MRFRSTTITALLFLILFSLVFPSYSCAGQVTGEASRQTTQKKEEAKEAQEEREKKILALLNEMVTNSTSITAPENRTQTLIRTSEMLWTRDEALARALVGKVKNEMLALNARLARGKKRRIWDQHNLSRVRQDLRSMVFGRA